MIHPDEREATGDPAAEWRARLELGFIRRERDTLLSHCRHQGPLRVQKALYPEGRELCHVILLHPPGGIAGGDRLEINLSAGERTQVLLTTPGAGKWYRSSGPWAGQTLDFDLGSGATLEWLPQETIVFDGARARLTTRVRLAAGARFIGWEILCLGRQACGEGFTTTQGELRLETRVVGPGGPLWVERGTVTGNDPLLHSPAGFAGHPVCATLWVAGFSITPELIAACRAITPAETNALHGISTLPEILVARYLGQSSEMARAWFIALWQRLRPVLLQRPALLPRIWNT